MKFARLAIVQFAGLESPFANRSARSPSAEVTFELVPGGPRDGRYSYSVVATSLSAGNTTVVDGALQLDQGVQLACEETIQAAATALALCFGAARHIFSLIPSFALYPDTESEKSQLASVRVTPYRMQTDFRASPTCTDPDKCLASLGDRTEGAEMLAECVHDSTALEIYRECVRLFERAFRLDFRALEEPLYQFLEAGHATLNLGYAREEVSDWIGHRNTALHADREPTPNLTFERNVQPLIARMHQAAYDVLFNKAEWRNPSPVRRNVWRPVMALTRTGVQGHEGYPFSVKVKFVVGTQAWPMRMDGEVELPEGWWVYQAPEASTSPEAAADSVTPATP